MLNRWNLSREERKSWVIEVNYTNSIDVYITTVGIYGEEEAGNFQISTPEQGHMETM